MEANKGQASRLAYIDNLRALMIIFVVAVHAAVTYSGLGSWYYKENQSVDFISTVFFALYLSFTQAYFMSLLFMQAGYFVPGSLEAKGAGRFISGRLFRLGVPLLIYIFIINPVCVKLAHPEAEMANYVQGIKSFAFISWTGPLWFAEALLIFTFIYVFFRKAFGSVSLNIKFDITVRNVMLLALLITVVAFAARLAFPLGTDVANLQLGYFPAYITMFFAGIASYRYGIFDLIDYKMGKRWFAAAFAAGLPLWIFIMFCGGPAQGVFLINGGMNWQAFVYALWESFFCVAVIIGLTGIFKHRFNSQSSFQKLLSDNAFGVYVFHAPILIGISVLFKGYHLYPILKFIIISSVALPASFIFSYLIRRISFFRSVFS